MDNKFSKFLFVFLGILALTLGFFLLKKEGYVSRNLTHSPTPLDNNIPNNYLLELDYNDNSYNIYYYLANSSEIDLFENLSNRNSGDRIIDEKGCKALFNGGFYDTQESLIGLFIRDGEKINNFRRNSLFNGIFTVSPENDAQITDNYQDESVKLALQGGPLLIENGVVRDLVLNRDNRERRTVISTMQGSESVVLFIVVADQDRSYAGPFLDELPGLIDKVSSSLNVPIDWALNLDGGTSSAFYIEDKVSLSELSFMGSYFCIR